MAGWVGALGSIILIVLGSITFQQTPLLIGDMTLVACILLIVCGTMKMAAGQPSPRSRPISTEGNRWSSE
jgi:hypothetical protein